jgi:23S rRNA pseudouridine2605 synthase
VSLARVLSKLGFCSRSQAHQLVNAGRVRVNGAICRNPAEPVDSRSDRLEVDGQPVRSTAKVYLMLNKPRGLVTTAADEHDRPTVFRCLADAGLPFVSPVGRLDMASEGLLLFSNDTEWAAGITNPETHLDKVYHVQVGCVPDATLLQNLERGVAESGEHLSAKQARLLRHGARHGWVEIVLDEGRNRHIRRLLGALGVEVLRLIRVSIGPLALGDLPKGQIRRLTIPEIQALAPGRPRA